MLSLVISCFLKMSRFCLKLIISEWEIIWRTTTTKNQNQNLCERYDISRATSGKLEFITQKEERKQKRWLLDTIKTFTKFLNWILQSYSYFCKQRPFWVLIPSVNQRDIHMSLQTACNTIILMTEFYLIIFFCATLESRVPRLHAVCWDCISLISIGNNKYPKFLQK